MRKQWTTIVLATVTLCGVASSTRCLRAESVKAATPATQARTVSFRVAEACSCAQCSFEAYHTLKKFEGVRKVTLDVGARRLDVMFDESKHSISDLAHALEKLDIGQGSTLLWPLAKGADAQQSSTRLAQVAGISSAKIDKKLNAVALTFAAKPSVTLAQLDAATVAKGAQ